MQVICCHPGQELNVFTTDVRSFLFIELTLKILAILFILYFDAHRDENGGYLVPYNYSEVLKLHAQLLQSIQTNLLAFKRLSNNLLPKTWTSFTC